MSVDRPSHDPQWHSSQARSIERLSRVLFVLATPVWLFWRIYYAIVGRPKPCRDSQGSLRAVRRCTPPWWKPTPPTGHNAILRETMREAAMYRRFMPPDPLTDDDLGETPVAYTIPIEGRIPPVAMIWNREQGHYDVYEEGKPPRTMADPWPDSPKTVREFLEKYPPVTAEEWLRRHDAEQKRD